MSDVSLLLSALHFAADKHRDQRRKGGSASPYINHPIDVARILSDEGGIQDVEVLAAALLHDTVEDTDATLAELNERFGGRVADIVEEVTDDKSLPKAERKRLQIEHAKDISEDGALVKVADKISNIRDVANQPPENWDLARRNEYTDWAEQVVSNCPLENSSLQRAFIDSLAHARAAIGNN